MIGLCLRRNEQSLKTQLIPFQDEFATPKMYRDKNHQTHVVASPFSRS